VRRRTRTLAKMIHMSAQPNELPFARYVPRAPLSDYVETLWIYDGYSVPHTKERLMPTGTMGLVFSLNAAGRIEAGLVGVQSRFMILDTSVPFSVIGVQFKSGGSFRFCGMTAGEFQELDVSLEAVWGSHANELQERLLQATSRAARFHILERELLSRARGRLEKHPAVPYALKLFGNVDVPCSVAHVTEKIGLSARRFIEVFRNEVGVSPKLYSRVRRFQKVLHALHGTPDPDLADVALSFGYFDQAHFIHEFREFSGISPSTYLRQRIYVNHVPILD